MNYTISNFSRAIFMTSLLALFSTHSMDQHLLSPSEEVEVKDTNEFILQKHLLLTGANSIVAFSSDEKTVLLKCWIGWWPAAVLFNIDTKKHTILKDNIRISSGAFSPDNGMILIGTYNKTAYLYDRKTGEEPIKLEGSMDSISAAVFSSDGKKVVLGSYDNKTAYLWDTQKRQELQQFIGHTHWILAVALSSDETSVLTASHDATARLWNASTGEQLLILRHQSALSSVAFIPYSSTILTSSYDKTARVWDTDGTLLFVLEHESPVRSTAVNHDGTTILTGSYGAKARLWDAKTGKLLKILSEPLHPAAHKREVANPISILAFSRDEKTILTGSLFVTLCTWILSTNPHKETLKSEELPICVTVSLFDTFYVFGSSTQPHTVTKNQTAVTLSPQEKDLLNDLQADKNSNLAVTTPMSIQNERILNETSPLSFTQPINLDDDSQKECSIQ
ncbi:WD40 repeat domain-containing protein [Candidatus Dependentiae bacterium]|nr:WD40 repeat domain-containing protein [Candidatus Dependentiae bacterium]